MFPSPQLRPNPNGAQELTVFIPAFLEDNPIGVAKDPDYESRLLKRDPDLARAIRWGDWSVFSGQLLREWSKQIHRCPAFAVPENWPQWRSVDWGFAAPWAVYWWAKNPDTRRTYITREIYKVGITDPLQARLIRENSDPNVNYTFTFADPSMWAAKTTEEIVKSTFEVYADNGVFLTKATNDHRSNIAKLHAILKPLPDGLPGLQVFEGLCPNLERTLPALMNDPRRPEDLLDGQEDHGFDSCCYGLTNWVDPFPQPPAKPKLIKQTVSGLEQLLQVRR